jgi:hypothetical protein
VLVRGKVLETDCDLIATSVRFFAFNFFIMRRYVDFDGAFAHVQLVGYYLIRLAFLDRPNDREFTGCDQARCRWLGRRVPWPTSPNQTVHWRIGPPSKNKAHRLHRELKSHGHWNVTLRAMANGGPSQLGPDDDPC